MATLIEVGQVKHFRARFVDAAGNPTTVDTRSPANVVVSDPALGVVENPSADGLEGDLRVTGIGAFQLQMTVDADRGDGVRELILTADVEGLAGEAVGGTIDFS